jgi:hypothetical protein
MTSKCPNCESDQWKSAKLLILEGTSKSQGSIEGSIDGELVQKGYNDKFLGGSALLSDNWFSSNSSITAEFDSTTSTMLVDEIKDLLVSEAASRPMPSPIEEPEQLALPEKPKKNAPTKPGFFSIDPAKKKPPKKPQKPNAHVKEIGEFEPRSTFSNFMREIRLTLIWILICLATATYFFPALAGDLFKYLLLTFDFVPKETEGYEDVRTHVSEL